MTRIQKCIVTLAVLLLAGCGPKDDQFVDAKAASEKQASGELLLDIRQADGYKEFHVPSSTNIPYGRLKLRLDELDSYKDKTIMLIDHSGVRSPLGWELLRKAGFSQVMIVKGGISEWKAAGLPVEELDMQQQ
ncbi:MAG: rhodanese-like domain-containing protein [Gallionellaceae bacterium]